MGFDRHGPDAITITSWCWKNKDWALENDSKNRTKAAGDFKKENQAFYDRIGRSAFSYNFRQQRQRLIDYINDTAASTSHLVSLVSG